MGRGLMLLLSTALAGSALAAPPKAGQSSAPRAELTAVSMPAKGNPVAGRAKSEDERCQECHGHDGNANDIEDGIGNIGKFPRLAGLHPDYIVKQIRDFRSGARHNDTMSVMARSLSDADLIDIAAYFGSQKRLPGDGRGDHARARRLFAEGDAARGLPACVSCHGEAGKGLASGDASSPAIGGQHRRYLHAQLHEWKSGSRSNSAGGQMNSIAKVLSDEEIDALSDFLAAQ